MFKKSSEDPTDLAVVFVHTVGHIKDPVYFNIVWVERLLVLQGTTNKAEHEFADFLLLSKCF